MHEVWIWSDLQGDFVPARDGKGKVVQYDDYAAAQVVAMKYLADGVQARVEYIRKRFVEKKNRKTMKSGRIFRSRIVDLGDGPAVISAFYSSTGRKLKGGF